MSPAPFRGLAADEPEHAELFHGREALTAELLDLAARSRERGRPFTVVGPSGSGKSSLLRAGPIPALGGDGSPLPGEWTCVILTPGERPLRGPAGRLAGPAGRPAETLHRELRDSAAAGAVVRAALGGVCGGRAARAPRRGPVRGAVQLRPRPSLPPTVPLTVPPVRDARDRRVPARPRPT